jgi:hypothetical protein
VLRTVSLVAFSVLIFVIVKRGIKCISPFLILTAVITICTISLLSNIDTVIPPIYDVKFVKNVVCIINTDFKPEIRDVIDALWITLVGILPLVLSVAVPISILCYIKCNQVSEGGGYNSAMAKFGLLLVAGNFINFLGLIIPLLAAREAVGAYVSYAFAIVSLIPTPILMLTFLKPVWKRFKQLLVCKCQDSEVQTLRKNGTESITKSGSLS